MKVRYIGPRLKLSSKQGIEIGSEFTVFQVGDCYFRALHESGMPVTLYEDEVELVNPPLGSPTAGKPEWMGTNARDYISDPVYSHSHTLEEKIETRGHIHELRYATPDDFEQKQKDSSYIGRVEIWSSSLIGEAHIETAYLLAMNSVSVGDNLLACREINSNGIAYFQFRDADGTPLPFSPYYDFNNLTLEHAFLRLRQGQRIVCKVTEIKAMTGTCAPAAPNIAWTVYNFVTNARIAG